MKKALLTHCSSGKPPGMMNIEVIFKASPANSASFETPLPQAELTIFSISDFGDPLSIYSIRLNLPG